MKIALTKVAFKNFASSTKCVTRLNDEQVKTAKKLDIIMPMYNLLEYSDNYADYLESFWQFERDEQNKTNDGIPNGVTKDNLTSFKYKSSLLKEWTADVANKKM